LGFFSFFQQRDSACFYRTTTALRDTEGNLGVFGAAPREVNAPLVFGLLVGFADDAHITGLIRSPMAGGSVLLYERGLSRVCVCVCVCVCVGGCSSYLCHQRAAWPHRC